MNKPHFHPVTPIRHHHYHMSSKLDSRNIQSYSDKSLTPIKKLSQQFLLHPIQKPKSTVHRNKSYFRCKFTYKSPQSTAASKKQNYAHVPTISNYSLKKELTPIKKVKKLSQLRNKIINKLQQVKTVQSKYQNNESSPIKRIQQSDILFRGSRDIQIQNVLVKKLTFQNNKNNKDNKNDILNKQLSQTKHQSSQKQYKQQKKQLYKIRKTDYNKYIVRQLCTMGIFSVYYNKNSEQYDILCVQNPNIMKIYHKPYQYCLKQLISMGKTSTQVMSKVTKQLNKVRQQIQNIYNTNIQMGTLCQIVYYVHGVVKILPLIKKKSLLF